MAFAPQTTAILCALLAGAWSCGGKTIADTQVAIADSSAESSAPSLSTVVGAGWELRVNRTWNHTYPEVLSEEFPESSYNPVANGPRYSVDFSADGSNVVIDKTMKGKLLTSGAPHLYYSIDEGLFAGGSFVVWISSAQLQGDLTRFGSGVLVIDSERGDLVKK